MAPHTSSSSSTTIRPVLLLLFLLLSTSTTLALGHDRRNGDALAWRRSLPVEVTPQEADARPAHRVRTPAPLITPAPSLLARQDQGQIQALSAQLAQISEASRAVSRASQQVSQSSQQLSQSLQQASQRLSETERQLASARVGSEAAQQASRSLSQQVQEASRRLDEARRSADQAVASASRSVSEAMAASMAGATRSFAEALARATADVMQKSQQDGEDLGFPPQQQGVSDGQVSGTTIALAVVGAVVGSSIITAVAFVLFVRFRRDKRRRGRGSMGHHDAAHPRKDSRYSLDKESVYSTDDNGFRADVKAPGPVAVRGSIGPSPVGSGRGGVGYALSYYGPYADEKGKLQQEHKKSGSAMSGSTAVAGFKLGMPPKPAAGGSAGGGKFAPFPTSPSGGASGVGVKPATTGTSSGSGNTTPPPSLDAWIRAGTVSPFGALKKAVGAKRGSVLAK